VGDIKLYKLPREWKSCDERESIRSEAELLNVLSDINLARKNGSDQWLLYVFKVTGSNSSPQCSPGKLLLSNDTSSKPSSNSKTSERNRSQQDQFRKALLHRDGDICRLCSSKPVEAAHIIDLTWKFSTDELRNKFNCYDIYSVTNGLILCKNCHGNYDAGVIGINSSGFLVKVQNGQFVVTQTNIYPKSPPSHIYPPAEFLELKFNKVFMPRYEDVPPREQIALIERFSALFSPNKNKKWKSR
jgi:hypothetical protein